MKSVFCGNLTECSRPLPDMFKPTRTPKLVDSPQFWETLIPFKKWYEPRSVWAAYRSDVLYASMSAYVILHFHVFQNLSILQYDCCVF